MRRSVFFAATLGLGFGLSQPVFAGLATNHLAANLVDVKTMDSIFAKSTQETQLARRDGHGGRGDWGGRHGGHGGRGDWGGRHGGHGGRGDWGGRHGGHGGHRGGHYRRNDWVGPAVGGAILGAIIANQASSRPYREEVIYREVPVYREEPVYREDGYAAAKRRCAAKYKSYDWRSETYVTYGGQVRSCP